MSEAAPLAGVFGWPVGHSRSPALHGRWLQRYGLPGAYVALPVRPEDFAEVLRAAPRMGFVGANVTLPHKEAAFALADEVSSIARKLKAANTLVFRDGRILADNTDGFGFLENLRQDAPGWRAEAGPATVFGAGGAARAIVAALAEAGAPEIRLLNRTRERAEALSADLDGPVRVLDWAEGAAAMAGASLLVNTTSLGMAGQPPFPFAFDAADPGALATDIVYVPLETPFLRLAAARGLATVDGLGMLLHQARPGFEAWFGRAPEVDGDLRGTVLPPEDGA